MKCVGILKFIDIETISPGGEIDLNVSVHRFTVRLRELWRERAKRDWPGALVCIKVTTQPYSHDSLMELFGVNNSGDEEDLDWLVPHYESDVLALYERVQEWAVPVDCVRDKGCRFSKIAWGKCMVRATMCRRRRHV